MIDYLHSTIKDITEPLIIKLIDELDEVTRVRKSAFQNDMLLFYLQQCLRPNGASTKQISIKGEKVKAYDYDNDFILKKKVNKFLDTELFWLFDQIGKLRGECIEQVHLQNKTVYVFLNYFFKEPAKKSKRKIDSVNYLWR